MPFYRTSFERINFAVVPPAKQSADVLFEFTPTEGTDEDTEAQAQSEAAWNAMWAQNPHWQAPPKQNFPIENWSSVLWNHKITPLDTADNTYVAWHIPSESWLLQDGVSVTVDVDEAGRFSLEGIRALKAQYPGERYSMVMQKRLGEIYEADGTPRIREPYRVRFDEYVLWGKGPKTGSYCYVEFANKRMQISDTLTFDFPFELPKMPGVQEYERRRSWAWKLFSDDQWTLVSSPEEADEQARAEALRIMRSRGDHDCSYLLAIKHNRKVTNALESAQSQV